MSKKSNQKAKKADTFTRFSCSADLQQSQGIDLDIKPVDHDRQPTVELANHIVSEHGQSCVESLGKESGEIEWDGRRYSFMLTSEVIDSDVSIEEWSDIEQLKSGSEQ